MAEQVRNENFLGTLAESILQGALDALNDTCDPLPQQCGTLETFVIAGTPPVDVCPALTVNLLGTSVERQPNAVGRATCAWLNVIVFRVELWICYPVGGDPVVPAAIQHDASMAAMQWHWPLYYNMLAKLAKGEIAGIDSQCDSVDLGPMNVIGPAGGCVGAGFNITLKL